MMRALFLGQGQGQLMSRGALAPAARALAEGSHLLQGGQGGGRPGAPEPMLRVVQAPVVEVYVPDLLDDLQSVQAARQREAVWAREDRIIGERDKAAMAARERRCASSKTSFFS